MVFTIVINMVKHISTGNDQQLTFKNIIVQYVNEKSISNQDHQDMTLNGSGKGLYITDGKAEEITWKRNDNADKTKYYDASGNEISRILENILRGRIIAVKLSL